MRKPSEKLFSITTEDSGNFIFRYPTMLDELNIDKTASQLLAGNDAPTIAAQNIAQMMATLKVMLKSYPDDFNLDEIYDHNDLLKIYNAYLEKVSQFRGGIPGRTQQEDPGGGTRTE